MNKLFCYGITRRALQLLQPHVESLNSVPDGWFNWFNPNLGGQAVDRLKCLDPDQSENQVLEWDRAAKLAGYGRVLVYSMEDPSAKAAHSGGLSNDVVIYPISHVPTLAELETYQDFLLLLREPESFFQDYWSSIKLGGSGRIARFGLDNVPVAHWLAFGQGLANWIEKTAKGKPYSMYRINCPDFTVWNGWKSMDINRPDAKLDLEKCWNSPQNNSWRWSLSNPCTQSDIPAMSLSGFVAYYPIFQMPCCGVAVRESGELVTIGALTSDWAWANEETVAAFEIIRKALQVTPGPAQPGFLTDEMTWVATGLRLLASSIYTPQKLGAADGRFITVEVSEFNMAVKLWIDTSDSDEKTAFVVTPVWQDVPERPLLVQVNFDGVPATMEVNSQATRLLGLQGHAPVSGVFLTTPSPRFEVRVYEAD